MPGESDTKRPEIHVDDDWKQRVKAEDAALDQQFRSEPPPQPTAAEQAEQQPAAESEPLDSRLIPPADFHTLVGMFSTQAMLSLGLFPNPATGKAEVQLELARHFIDLLGVIDEKTKGNLSPPEHSLLETTLHQLRMAYVELTRPRTAAPAEGGTQAAS
jgi:hypothetical protein